MSWKGSGVSSARGRDEAAFQLFPHETGTHPCGFLIASQVSDLRPTGAGIGAQKIAEDPLVLHMDKKG